MTVGNPRNTVGEVCVFYIDLAVTRASQADSYSRGIFSIKIKGKKVIQFVIYFLKTYTLMGRFDAQHK